MSNNKPNLFSISEVDLENYLQQNNEPKFRTKQIYQLALLGNNFENMQTLPKQLREKLNNDFTAQAVNIFKVFESKLDSTVKFLFVLNDANIVEGVLMQYKYGYTLCISTQVGCKMACKFCASTLNGCVRNLSQAEMLGQIIVANKYLGIKGKISRVVLMGSGEALDNYDNTIEFLKLVHNPNFLNISYRNISLSTCGLVLQILRLLDENIPLTLSISLHAPNDEIRKQIMPIANAYNINELMNAARQYFNKTGRRIIFEYALIHKLNCSVKNAKELALLLKNLQAHVNIISLNYVAESSLLPATNNETRDFINELEKQGVSFSKRRTMGNDIAGACGQLRNSLL